MKFSPCKALDRRVLDVRGVKVTPQELNFPFFDRVCSCQATVYQVETKRLNEAVKRNIARFPNEFRSQLNEKELESLRSQFATLKK